MRRRLTLAFCLFLVLANVICVNAQQKPGTLSEPQDMGDGFECKMGVTQDEVNYLYVKFPKEFYPNESTDFKGTTSYKPEGKFLEGIQKVLVKMFKCEAFKNCVIEIQPYGDTGAYIVHFTGKAPVDGTAIGFRLLRGSFTDNRIIGISIVILGDK